MARELTPPAIAADYARARRRGRLESLALVAPLLVFIIVTFAAPIAAMLTRSFYTPEFADIMPRTEEALSAWQPGALPSDAVVEAVSADLIAANEAKTIGRAASRFNFEFPGGRTLLTQTARALGGEPARTLADLVALDPRWGAPATWAAMALVAKRVTGIHYLAALDLRLDDAYAIVPEREQNQIYITLFLRTLWVAGLVTFLCLALGYPVAFVLAHLPIKMSNLLMILVLLPFWTSLLVRTTSWIVLLQSQGVINDLLVGTGFIANDQRLAMIYNATGTITAMTHILLPFMVLPLYSVMRTIPSSYARAARSMGASPMTTFLRVYAPLTLPGVGAGGLLVFILALGYYITPALVGGQSGQLISNIIAFHMQSSLNWGLAAALGAILLGGVLGLYLVYARVFGVERMRFA
ncbi:MAG: ABC transporter permease subunit [Alphaproteobacteria bacterium]|nr:ABC transporter permease subunit [Alphaproteobacteria bacterium]